MNCAVCNSACEKQCSQCNTVYYCSREHQKQDWKTHKPNCLPYLIARNDELGRHMVATRKIKCYEVVLREAPLVSGPGRRDGQPCLGCYKDLTKMEKHITCAKCGCPMCSVECAESRVHYPECSIIAQHSSEKVKGEKLETFKPVFDAAVSVLRCLHLKQEQPKKWKKINNLESNVAKNMDNNICMDIYIRLALKISVFSTEEIMKMTSICNTNGHQTAKNQNSLYYNASFMEHNCFANCFKNFSKTGEIVLVAARDIEPGEHLSISYIEHVYGTAKRRRLLLKHFHFSCKCARCVDHTELGSHFSSLKCQNRGCTGFVIPMDALEVSSDWKCTSCDFTMLASQVDELIQYWDVKLENLHSSSSVYLHRQLIKECDILFHPNHYNLTAIKISLAELPGARYEACADELTSKILVEILQYCQQLRDLMAKLMPADNGARAAILFCIVDVLSTLKSVENCNKYQLSSVEYEKLYMEINNLLRYYEGADCNYGGSLAAARLMLMFLKFKTSCGESK